MKKWLEDPRLNIWFGQFKGDATIAKCKVCRTIFKLCAMVKWSLKDHSGGKKHQPEVRKMKTFFLPVSKPANKIFSTVSSQSAEQSLDIFFYTSQIIVTEIIWALKTVSSGQSRRSNEITVDCFIKIFPDSKIIESVSIGKTKSI